jgi:hypothetical protein
MVNNTTAQIDEKANITYLAELMKVMPALESVPPPVKKDPRQAALDYAAEHIDDTIEKLKQLCKYRPDETDAAADKVYFNLLNIFSSIC